VETVIYIDRSDDAPCNFRCASGGESKTFCAGYPHCAAGVVHHVQALFGRRHTLREVTASERRRSPLGGYTTTRIVHDAEHDAQIEEIELHCQTLKFESLLRKDPKPTPAPGKGPPAAAPPAAAPSTQPPT
jgi:hypothetical protein